MKTSKIIALSLSIAFLTSCSKTETATTDTSATSKTITTDDVISNVAIDASLDDISAIAEDQSQNTATARESAAKPRRIPALAGATRTVNLSNTEYKSTVDFGTGTTMPNGNVLKGKITTTIPTELDALNYSKTTITCAFNGFKHNDNLVDGTNTVTYELKKTTSLNSNHPVITTVINQTITKSDGKYTRTGTRIKEMIAGYDTADDYTDDVYSVTGSTTTTFPSEAIYTSTIKTALKIKMNCDKPFPTEGTVEIEKNTGKATLNYGTGTCDALATITPAGGTATEITLKK